MGAKVSANLTDDSGAMDWWFSNGTIFDQGLISFPLYSYQKVLHPIIVLVGISLNLSVASVLLSDRKLLTARNVAWLGIIASNLIYFAVLSLEYFVFYEESYVICQFLSVVSGNIYVVLLVNLFIATCDRLIYTKWSGFHQKHVTVKKIVTTQLVASVLVFLTLTFQFWALKMPMKCGVELSSIQLTLGAIISFTLICIALKSAIYYLLIRKCKASRIDGIVTREIKLSDLSTSNSRENQPSSNREGRVRLYSHESAHSIQENERKSTQTLIFGLIPLCLMVLLSFVCIIWQFLCNYFYGECQPYQSMLPYLIDLSLLHASTDLLAYISRSIEFRNATRKMLRRHFKCCN